MYLEESSVKLCAMKADEMIINMLTWGGDVI